MRLQTLSIENWRSFGGPVSISLSPLTLFIGPNNAGKSNVLHALDGLRSLALPNPPRLAELGDTSFCFHRGAEKLRLGLTFECEGKVGSYAIGLERSGAYEESIQWSQFNTHSKKAPGHGRHGLEHLGTTGDKGLLDLGRMLREFQVWRLEPSGIGLPSPVQKTERLNPNGGNAAALLDYLKDMAPTTYEQVQRDVQRCAPELSGVTAVATEHQGHKEVVFIEKSGLRIPARHASEGLRVLLFVLLIEHSPSPPPLFAIEDLDAGIHPRRIEDVVGFLRRLTQAPGGPQVLLTSHSPLVLDQFRDVPEQVVVVERGPDGNTLCASLADRLNSLQGVPTDTALGDLWYSGVLGGVPSK
jgi:predicted ATPase